MSADDIVTPDQIVAELRGIRAKAEAGPDQIFSAEVKYDDAMRLWQTEYDIQYAKAQGTVADREIQARGFSSTQKEALDSAKATLNYTKARVKQLEMSQMNVSVQLKAISLTYNDGVR